MTLRQITDDTIPDTIASIDQWICWREEERDGNVTKIPTKPYHTTGSRNAKTNDPDTWREFATALTYHRSGESQTDGVGFVFTDDTPVVGIDLDDCRDPDTESLTDWAQDIVERLDSYAEVSPSGTGVHVLLTGDLPDGRRQRDGVEMYEDGRFFTVTGAHLGGTPETVNRRADALGRVHADYVQPSSGDTAGGTDAGTPAVASDSGGERSASSADIPEVAVEPGVYPDGLCEPPVERWVTWTESDIGGLQAYAPWEYGAEYSIKWKDGSDLWTDFATAREWADKLPGHGLAFVIRDREASPDEEYVVIDYDDVRDPESRAVHPTVRDHLLEAASYADVSRSGTGIHLLCRGSLPDGIRTITDTLPHDPAFPDASIEVYASTRLVPMTGTHVACTPTETRPAQGFLAQLAAAYASTGRGAAGDRSPTYSEAEIAAMESTADYAAIQDAIHYTDPSDIRLASPVTEERADGTKSRDPVWTHSESGTRLGELSDGWVYRDGNIGLNALQVVALEEGIITNERTVPRGQDFFDALDALRARGAKIPEFTGGTAESAAGAAAEADRGRGTAGGTDRSPQGGATDATVPDAGGDVSDPASHSDAEAGGQVADSAGASASQEVASGEGGPPSSGAPPTDAAIVSPSASGDGGGTTAASADDASSDGDTRDPSDGAGGDGRSGPEAISSEGPATTTAAEAGSDSGEDDRSTWRAGSDSGLVRKFGQNPPDIADEALEFALHQLSPDKIPAPLPRTLDDVGGPGHDLSDEEVLSRAFDSKSGDRIEWLYEGDAALWDQSDSPYISWKRAASALTFYLAFWTGGDVDQMERLFRESGLYREEWEHAYYSETVTYGEVALLQAVLVIDEYYTPAGTRSPAREPWGSKTDSRAAVSTADPARLRGAAGHLDEDALETAKLEAARARRYEQEFRACRRQLTDCRELVRELWERLRLYREVVGVDPERTHDLDPETLTAAGVDAVTEDGPPGRPPAPPDPPSPGPAGEEAIPDVHQSIPHRRSRGGAPGGTDESIGPSRPRSADGGDPPDTDGRGNDGASPADDDRADDTDRSGFLRRFLS